MVSPVSNNAFQSNASGLTAAQLAAAQNNPSDNPYSPHNLVEVNLPKDAALNLTIFHPYLVEDLDDKLLGLYKTISQLPDQGLQSDYFMKLAPLEQQFSTAGDKQLSYQDAKVMSGTIGVIGLKLYLDLQKFTFNAQTPGSREALLAKAAAPITLNPAAPPPGTLPQIGGFGGQPAAAPAQNDALPLPDFLNNLQQDARQDLNLMA